MSNERSSSSFWAGGAQILRVTSMDCHWTYTDYFMNTARSYANAYGPGSQNFLCQKELDLRQKGPEEGKIFKLQSSFC